MAARPPPLLLTKRLTSFLHLNLSAHITTLLLLTPDGKLLAYASNPPIPIATLRTHATVAASLYAIHSAGTDRETIHGALGPIATHHQRVTSSSGNASRQAERIPAQHQQQQQRDNSPLAVTIQLESGVVLVIRRLQCGMLFVCMGPPDGRHAQAQQQSQTQSQIHQEQQQQQQPHSEQQTSHTSAQTGAIQATSNASAPLRDSPSIAAAAANGGGHQTPSTSPPPQTPHGHSHAGPNLGSPSDVASVLSAATTAQTTASSVTFGAGTAGVMTARRHAEELAKWLDDRLGALEVPVNGFGGVV